MLLFTWLHFKITIVSATSLRKQSQKVLFTDFYGCTHCDVIIDVTMQMVSEMTQQFVFNLKNTLVLIAYW